MPVVEVFKVAEAQRSPVFDDMSCLFSLVVAVGWVLKRGLLELSWTKKERTLRDCVDSLGLGSSWQRSVLGSFSEVLVSPMSVFTPIVSTLPNSGAS